MSLGTPLIVAVLLGALVFTAYLAIDLHLSRKKKVELLKNRMVASNDDYYTPDGELADLEDRPSALASGIEGIFSALGVDMAARRLDLKAGLMHAGINSPNAPAFLLAYRYFVGIVIGLMGVGLFFIPAEGTQRLLYVLLGLLCVALGFFGSQIYLSNSKQKRQKKLTLSFPDTLDLMVVCVESGLALDAALNRVTSELGRSYPEITAELNRTKLELALLNDRSRALTNLAERTDLIPFRSLVAALLQTEKFGTSLTDTLRVLSDDYRHTRLMIAENKAGRLPALMTVPLILFLLPALLIVLLGGPYINYKQMGDLSAQPTNATAPP